MTERKCFGGTERPNEHNLHTGINHERGCIFFGRGVSLGKTISRKTNHVDAHSELGNTQQRGAMGGGR